MCPVIRPECNVPPPLTQMCRWDPLTIRVNNINCQLLEGKGCYPHLGPLLVQFELGLVLQGSDVVHGETVPLVHPAEHLGQAGGVNK